MHEAFLDRTFHLIRKGRPSVVDLYIDHVTLDGGNIEKQKRRA